MMASGESQGVMTPQMELAQSVLAEIKTLLENEKKRLYDEIRNYPPPIAGCDQQYNHLLEERTRIAQELNRMHEMSKKIQDRTDAIQLICQFVDASRFIAAETKKEILSRLKDGGADRRGYGR